MKTQTRNSSWFSLEFACLLAIGGLAGVLFGACKDDGDDLGVFGEQDCKQYCDRVVDCDGNKDRQDCIDNCIDRMGNCQADEQDAALDQLQDCSNATCDNIVGCTIDAGATCYFGL
jgi:hypothetical protein